MILDIGCGNNKHNMAIGMDKRNIEGIDIMADAEHMPYPFKDKTFNIIIMNHLLEHIKPWLSIDVINQCWQLLVDFGILIIKVPYAPSHRYYQDPTHCNPCNETTFEYFDSDYKLWGIYKPLPWKILKLEYNSENDIEVILQRRNNNGTYN